MSEPTAVPRILLVTNANAGTSDEEAISAALTVFEAHADVAVAATSSPEELDDALAHADDRAIVVAGGDGSLHAVVASLHRTGRLMGAVLGLLPLGTGNDFARTLGVPFEPATAAQVVVAGHAIPVDLVVDDHDDVTVNHVHIGAGAEAGARGARWKERLHAFGVGRVNLGKLGYPVGALLTAVNPPVLRVVVEVDGEVVVEPSEPVLMVAVGNGASVGGGTELTPDAQPDDGLVDVLIATPQRGRDRVGFAARLPFGRQGERDDVRLLRGRTVRVMGTPFECNSDGEIGDPVDERTWRVIPAAYRMLVPGPTSVDDGVPDGDGGDGANSGGAAGPGAATA